MDVARRTGVTGGPAEAAREVRSGGHRAARSRPLEALARAGLAARALVYGIIGGLALQLALGDGGRTTDQQGALRTIAEQPFGKALLLVVAVGLFGYAAWRLVRAAVGHGAEAHDDAKERVGGAASGLVYAVLFVAALKIALGSGGGSGGGGGEDAATGGVLGWPAGPYIVGAAALVLVGVALDQARKGLGRSFLDDSKTEQMRPRTKRAFTAAGVFGHLARTVVFGVMGWFLMKAAIEFDADEAVSLDGALSELRDAAYGPVLLGAVAIGLLGFAAYSAMDARFRRV
jgi:hypothetical protein